MATIFVQRLVLGAGLSLGALDLAWLNLALGPRAIASSEPSRAVGEPSPAAGEASIAAREPSPAAGEANIAAGERVATASQPGTATGAIVASEPAPAEPGPAPAVVQQPEPVHPAVTRDAYREQVFFDTLDTDLDGASRASIDAAVERAGVGATYVLAGHADYRGEEALNRKLGRSRARAVETYLGKLGVAPERIHIDYVGEAAPSPPNELWRDRRVDIHIIGGTR